jgi:hypothetical protein
MTTRAGLVAISIVAAAFAAACGPTHKTSSGTGSDAGPVATDAAPVDTGPLPHTLESIAITPTNPLIQLDLNTESSQGFVAMAEYSDGSAEDVSATATWTVANPMVGAMTGSTLLIPAFTSAGAQTSVISATANGVTGQAQITVVAYRQTGPQTDFFFILPYQDPMGAQSKPLAFSTAVPALDVFFLMDTTGSMTGEIQNLQNALTSTVIPGITTAVANSEFGVGALEDFPISPYGSTDPIGTTNDDCRQGTNQPDQPLKLMQPITASTTAVQTGVAALSTMNGNNVVPIGCGDDWPEGSMESIYQAASGSGLTGPSPTSVPANHTGIGGVGFRQGTMPVIVTISDADSHGPDRTGTCTIQGFGTQSEQYTGTVAAVAHTTQNTKDALNGICARFVGIAAIQNPNIYSASCTPESYMTDLATSTGARVPPAAWDVGTRPAGCSESQCCTAANGAGRAPDANGLCPVVFDVSTDGTGVSTNIVTGIQMLTRFAQFTVTDQTIGVGSDTSGNPLPAPHTTADFLKSIQPTSFMVPAAPPVIPDPTFDQTSFYSVTPGTVVSFAVHAFNDFVPQTSQAQIFSATITVLAGGCTPLDQRDVLILVPPMPITIN